MVALKLIAHLPVCTTIQARKQERRGGIETGPGEEWHDVVPGSRNAVVALKLRRPARRSGSSRTKQERRGGIETRISAARGRRFVGEAGTPWWH